jgi:predicted transcriptional regulator
MAVALLYEGGPTKAFIIAVKIAKIESLEPESVEDAHLENLTAATAHQVENYVWRGEKVEILQKVVVSGVWRPSTTANKAYELKARYQFLPPVNVSHTRRLA